MIDSAASGQPVTPRKPSKFPLWIVAVVLVIACILIGICGILLAWRYWPFLQVMKGFDQVNTDGFACSIAMSINIADATQLGDQFSEVDCDELKQQYKTSLSEKPYERIEDWLVAETTLLLEERGIPLKITQIANADRVPQIEENIPSGVPTIAVVILPEFVHCIVIGEYDPLVGYSYLDPLQEIENNRAPNEQDFLEDYGVKLQDAWLYTFEITPK